MSAQQLVGVLLAAGKGTRMGRTKQLIEMPCANGKSQPLVALAFDSIAWACHHMVIVVDADRQRVIESLGQRAFTVAEAPDTQQMSDSLLAGLQVAHQQWPDHTILLQLADHPDVLRDTVYRLRDESFRYPHRTLIPTFQGKGGHPILIPPYVIRRLTGDVGFDALDAYWRQHPELCIRCAMDDDSVVRDLDDPAQLADEVTRRSNS